VGKGKSVQPVRIIRHNSSSRCTFTGVITNDRNRLTAYQTLIVSFTVEFEAAYVPRRLARDEHHHYSASILWVVTGTPENSDILFYVGSRKFSESQYLVLYSYLVSLLFLLVAFFVHDRAFMFNTQHARKNSTCGNIITTVCSKN